MPINLSEGRESGMKSFLGVMIFLAGIGSAQVNGNDDSKVPDPGKEQQRSGTVLLCRLESVSWNPGTEELSWVISARDVSASEDQPTARQKYTIHVDTAIMSFNGEGRRFDSEEAQRVGELMNLISTYTVESTAWWAKGLGEKVNRTEDPPSQNKGPDKPGENKPKPTPSLKAPAIPVSVPIPEARRWAQSSPPRN